MGDDMSLTVVADGGAKPYAYQWMKDGINITVVDGKQALLHIPNVDLTDAGDYKVTITDALGASVDSNEVTITVNAPALTGITLTNASKGTLTGSPPTYNLNGLQVNDGAVTVTINPVPEHAVLPSDLAVGDPSDGAVDSQTVTAGVLHFNVTSTAGSPSMKISGTGLNTVTLNCSVT